MLAALMGNNCCSNDNAEGTEVGLLMGGVKLEVEKSELVEIPDCRGSFKINLHLKKAVSKNKDPDVDQVGYSIRDLERKVLRLVLKGSCGSWPGLEGPGLEIVQKGKARNEAPINVCLVVQNSR